MNAEWPTCQSDNDALKADKESLRAEVQRLRSDNSELRKQQAAKADLGVPLEELLNLKMVHADFYAGGAGYDPESEWSITQAGQGYLVKHGLLK